MVPFLRGSFFLIFCLIGTVLAEIIPSSNCIPWSLSIVGIPGGIPNRTTIFTNMTPGATAAEINAAIAAAPSNSVVYLPSGTYNLSANLNAKTGITLRGDGMSNTVLVVTQGTYGIRCASTGISAQNHGLVSGYTKGSSNLVVADSTGLSIGSLLILTETNEPGLVFSAWGTKGGETFTASDDGGGKLLLTTTDPCPFWWMGMTVMFSTTGALPGGLTAGVYFYLSKVDDSHFKVSTTDVNATNGVVLNYSTAGSPVNTVTPVTYRLTHDELISQTNCLQLLYQQIVEVQSIAGNNLVIWPPLVYDLKAALTPVYAHNNAAVTTMFGVENMSIIVSNTALYGFYSELGKYLWIKGCEIAYGEIANTGFVDDFRSEIRDCYIHDTRSANEGYGVLDYGCVTGQLIENNIFCGHYVGVVFEQTVGSIVGYNYFWRTRSGLVGSIQVTQISANHGPHGMMNLFEGNMANGIWNDGYHGSTSHQTMFRNQFHGLDIYTNGQQCVNLYQWSYYHSLVGNILGDASWSSPTGYYTTFLLVTNDPGGNSKIHTIYGRLGQVQGELGNLDSVVTNTMIRHGNYDFYNSATLWEPTIADHNLPASLYLTSKPTWFSNATWPPIGPDVSGMTNMIPAQYRYLGLDYAGSTIQILGKATFKGKATIR